MMLLNNELHVVIRERKVFIDKTKKLKATTTGNP